LTWSQPNRTSFALGLALDGRGREDRRSASELVHLIMNQAPRTNTRKLLGSSPRRGLLDIQEGQVEKSNKPATPLRDRAGASLDE